MSKPSIEYVKSFLFDLLKKKEIAFSFSDSVYDLKIKAGYAADAVVDPFGDAVLNPPELAIAEEVVVKKGKKEVVEPETDK